MSKYLKNINQEDEELIKKRLVRQYQAKERKDKNNQVIQVLFWDDPLLYTEIEFKNDFEDAIFERISDLERPKIIVTRHR